MLLGQLAKKHDTPTREEHGHDNSHEAHDHGHAKGNLLLPHFGIKKVYHPPEVSTSTYRNLWPVASSEWAPDFPDKYGLADRRNIWRSSR